MLAPLCWFAADSALSFPKPRSIRAAFWRIITVHMCTTLFVLSHPHVAMNSLFPFPKCQSILAVIYPWLHAMVSHIAVESVTLLLFPSLVTFWFSTATFSSLVTGGTPFLLTSFSTVFSCCTQAKHTMQWAINKCQDRLIIGATQHYLPQTTIESCITWSGSVCNQRRKNCHAVSILSLR